MRQYIYKPEHVSMRQWPSGELRLDGIEVTEDATKADIFVCPGNIRIFEQGTGVLNMAKLNRLPHFTGNEARHVFFDCSDNFKAPINLPIIFIRCDVRTWMLPHDPNTIQVAWPVEDFAECIPVPDGGFMYDVSFHAWLSSDARKNAAESILPRSDIAFDYAGYSDFTGYIYHEPEGLRRRAEFRRSMRDSRVALCPESIPGVLPYRFFEAMSAGRVPVLVGSDYVLPFADEIPYEYFVIQCSTENASNVGNLIRSFLDEHDDEAMIEFGLMARRWWDKYLNAKDWPKTMAYAVEKHLCPTAA